VAGRFPVYTDADIKGSVVAALRRAGWDILRAIDELPEGTKDLPHFERAAARDRVLVTNDRRFEVVAHSWLAEGRRFRGMVCWPRSRYRRMSPGDFVRAFEELALQDDPFASYPIIHLKPKR
jgi:hypothetical protein